MRILIRPVTTADAKAWEHLRNALWPGDPHDAEIAAFFAATIDEPEAVLVAQDASGALVAVVELSRRRDLPGMHGAVAGYIEGLYVEPDHRASGLVWRLLRAARDWAREQGCTDFASDRDDRVVFDRSFRSRAHEASAPDGTRGEEQGG